jgi:hypothetical protein
MTLFTYLTHNIHDKFKKNWPTRNKVPNFKQENVPAEEVKPIGVPI